MTELIYYGAINKEDKKYTLPIDANKQNKYICPDCNDDVILKKGVIKRPHFSHKANQACVFYKSSNNSNKDLHTHKYAQYLLKKLYDDKITINIKRQCNHCNKHYNNISIKKESKCELIIEYKYNYKNSNKQIDCAIIKDNEPIYFIEVYNTHKTKDEDRPFFYEITAQNIIDEYNKYYVKNEGCLDIFLKDIREVECKKCIDETEQRIDAHNKKIWLLKHKKHYISVMDSLIFLNNKKEFFGEKYDDDDFDWNQPTKKEFFGEKYDDDDLQLLDGPWNVGFLKQKT